VWGKKKRVSDSKIAGLGAGNSLSAQKFYTKSAFGCYYYMESGNFQVCEEKSVANEAFRAFGNL
jgi:hypothetical protein